MTRPHSFLVFILVIANAPISAGDKEENALTSIRAAEEFYDHSYSVTTESYVEMARSEAETLPNSLLQEFSRAPPHLKNSYALDPQRRYKLVRDQRRIRHRWDTGVFRTRIAKSTNEGRIFMSNSQVCYDGENTRVRLHQKFSDQENVPFGNLRDGPPKNTRTRLPHQTLMMSHTTSARLSDWITGSTSRNDWDYQFKWSHEENIDEIQCEAYDVNVVDGHGETRLQFRIWFAVGRNWLPARMDVYEYSSSKSSLSSTARVIRWTELLPGVWLPEVSTHKVFRKDPATASQPELNYEYVVEIEEFSLDKPAPDCDEKVQFEDGDDMYVVAADGRIVDEYTVGLPKIEDLGAVEGREPRGRMAEYWPALAGLGVLTSLLLLWWRSR